MSLWHLQGVVGLVRDRAANCAEDAPELPGALEAALEAREQAAADAAMLQEAAEAVLLGSQPQLPRDWTAAAVAAPTMQQLAKAVAAASAALRSPALLAAQQQAPFRAAHAIGAVCSALFGVELQGCEMEAAGKRLQNALSKHEQRLKKLRIKLKQDVGDARRRDRNSDPGSLAAKLAGLEARAAAERASLCSWPAPALRPSMPKGQASPPAAEAALLNEQGAAEKAESSAADVLLAINAQGAGEESAPARAVPLRQREWSCARCSELLEDAAKAREAAAAAQRAQCSASEGHAKAWADLQRAGVAHAEEIERLRRELGAAHARELVKQRSAAEREARKGSAAEVLELQRRVVLAEGRQHTVCAGTHHTVQELTKVKRKLEKAEAQLRAAREAADAADAAETELCKEHARRQAALQQEITRHKEEQASEQLRVDALESKIASEATRRGLAEAKVAALERQAAAATRPQRERTSREASMADEASARSQLEELQRSMAGLHAHISSRDAAIKKLQARLQLAASEELALKAKIKELESERRQQAAQQPQQPAESAPSRRYFEARSVRTCASPEAPMEPYTMELLRRAVDEGNISFHSLAKIIPVIWRIFFVEPIPDLFLFSATSVSNAFLKLDVMDSRAQREANENSAGAAWAFASDGGNKGIAVNIVAASVWDPATSMPGIQPIACASLDGDQSARNCSETVIEALSRSGLDPGACVQGESDGCTTAKNETRSVLDEMHRLDCFAQGVDASQRDRLSVAETCAIHGKALEERAFLLEAFPLFVDGLRLLWEIIKGDGGQLAFYRQVWCQQAKLNPHMFESALAQVRGCALAGCGRVRSPRSERV